MAKADRSDGGNLRETIDLARRYVLQETVGPLKQIGRILGFGLAGALVAGIGGILVLVGVLRVLESETGQLFSGRWSFAPYLLTAAAALVLGGIVAVVGIRALSQRRAVEDSRRETRRPQ